MLPRVLANPGLTLANAFGVKSKLNQYGRRYGIGARHKIALDLAAPLSVSQNVLEGSLRCQQLQRRLAQSPTLVFIRS